MTACPHCGCSPHTTDTLAVGNLSVTPDGSVHWYGEPVPMTNSQRQILAALVSAAPHFVTNKALYAHIGSTADDPIKPHGVINVHICNLRAALRRAGAPTCILNEYGRGYRLDVDALQSPATPGADVAASVLRIAGGDEGGANHGDRIAAHAEQDHD